MKVFIIGLAVVIVCTYFIVFQQDYNLNQLENMEVKFVAEEAAAAAAQYYDKLSFSNGIYKLNPIEGTKAAEYIIKKDLKLNDDFTPIADTYWTDRITYTIEYFDDTNTTYPLEYNNASISYTDTVVAPTVIVTINCGRAKYRVPYIINTQQNIRAAAHEFKPR